MSSTVLRVRAVAGEPEGLQDRKRATTQ
jgi:hypothetical protein